MTSEEATTHKLDHETFGVGAVILTLGVVLGPIGAALGGQSIFIDGTLAGLVLFIPGAFGILCCIPFGLWAVRVPTARATLRVDARGLAYTFRSGAEVDIPWSAISTWDLVPKPLGWTKSLYVWPNASPPPELERSASKLWDSRKKAWLVEAVDPPKDLVEAFERAFPPHE